MGEFAAVKPVETDDKNKKKKKDKEKKKKKKDKYHDDDKVSLRFGRKVSAHLNI
jgi:hypothetical protein